MPPNGQVTFCYRIEIGSFRRADRKFCVKVSPAADHVAGVQPVCTPGVLVLSKKRLATPQPTGSAKRPLTNAPLDLAEIIERGVFVIVERSRVIQTHVERRSSVQLRERPFPSWALQRGQITDAQDATRRATCRR